MVVAWCYYDILLQSGYFARRGEGTNAGIEIMNDRRLARVDYDYTGRRFRIREFIDDGSPFPGPNDREYTDEELFLYNEVIHNVSAIN